MAVSAGYAPVSIGAETDGSLICPAGRASLYTIKPGTGFAPQDGIVPISSHFDSAGPMAKTVYDLVVVLDAIRSNAGSESLMNNIAGSWEDISVGTLDPEVWKFPDSIVKPVTEATEQIVGLNQSPPFGAYPLTLHFSCKISTELTTLSRAKPRDSRQTFHWPHLTPLSSMGKIARQSSHVGLKVPWRKRGKALLTRAETDLKSQLNSYLEDLNESKVRSLEDIIVFNKKTC